MPGVLYVNSKDQTQVFMLTKQAIYCLNDLSIPFFGSVFVSHSVHARSIGSSLCHLGLHKGCELGLER